jgi:hypothetical protein
MSWYKKKDRFFTDETLLALAKSKRLNNNEKSLLTQFVLGKTDKQKVFDHVYNQIIRQAQPAYGTSGCVLLDDNGCKCALGHLLSDPELEIIYLNQKTMRVGISAIAMYLDLPMPIRYDRRNYTFLNELRAAHDEAFETDDVEPFIKGFEARMKVIASEHNLKLPYE